MVSFLNYFHRGKSNAITHVMRAYMHEHADIPRNDFDHKDLLRACDKTRQLLLFLVNTLSSFM